MADGSDDAKTSLMEACAVGEVSVAMQSGPAGGQEAWKGGEEEVQGEGVEVREGKGEFEENASSSTSSSMFSVHHGLEGSKSTASTLLPPVVDEVMAESNIKLGKRSRDIISSEFEIYTLRAL